jgi:hypothetical protein
MTFDNSKTIINLRIRFFVMTVLFLAFLVLTYFAKIIKYPVLGMGDTAWTLIFVALFLIVAFYPMILKYQFISYSDEGDDIILRYFRAGMMTGRKNSVEISKRSFTGFQVNSRYLGLIKSIVLFQKIRDRTAKYPPVYITALKKEERVKLIRSLNSFVRRV